MKKRTVFFKLSIICLILATCFFAGKELKGENSEQSLIALLQIKPEYVSEYNVRNLKPNQVYFEMEFGDYKIKNTAQRKAYSGRPVIQVELIYSNYKLADDFKQPELNKERLEALKKISPELFKNNLIKWKFISQKGFKTLENAKMLFHGFVITYLPAPTKESMEAEEHFITSKLDNDSIGEKIVTLTERYKFKRKRIKTGLFYPILKYKKRRGILYDNKGIFGRRPQFITLIDTLILKDSMISYKPSEYTRKYLSSFNDSVVLAVLNRNKQWKNMLIVCDVTGSMSPYSTQLLLWNKLNFESRRAAGFTFFNDGDDTPDRRKVIGRTGGIYHTKASSIKEIENMAHTAMTRGGGGDGPENNIEAVLAAIEKFPEAGDIVMIVDNYAPIKDISLLYKLNKPVHVIICGTWMTGGVNLEYLQLALATKGSVHTMEQDIDILMETADGKKITINNQTYIIKDKGFSLVTDI